MRFSWLVVVGTALFWACSPSSKGTTSSHGGGRAGGAGSGGSGTGGGGGAGAAGTGGSGLVLIDAGDDSGCTTCANPCDVAVATKQSVGCEYYATMMDNMVGDVCFAVFVANTSSVPAHLTVEFGGSLDVADFTRIPSGAGPGLTYGPYDPVLGLPPNEVAILFLSGPTGEVEFPSVPCPVRSAIPTGVFLPTTGVGRSFRVVSDVPVVAYQMNPYGGAGTSVTGASLLLPTSVWDTNYVVASAFSDATIGPSMNIVAQANLTRVTIVPVRAVVGGGAIPASPANVPFDILLDRGQQAQITQEDLTGSVLSSDKPVGFMAGHECMEIPDGTLACDHGEQMVPPIRALGNEYVGVMHRPRGSEPALWRIIGAANGTRLTWSSDVGGPESVELGEVFMFTTGEPFVVKSQDKDHPFLLFAHMVGVGYASVQNNAGDPDSVLGVPPEQYLSHYVFFADPTYPETNLVVVRTKVDGAFADVVLDCAGPLADWTPIGDYEWTRADLVKGNFESVGGCSAGRHVIDSDNPFGLWIWGWGSSLTEAQTTSVSYGYPGGMNVKAINPVIIPPIPR